MNIYLKILTTLLLLVVYICSDLKGQENSIKVPLKLDQTYVQKPVTAWIEWEEDPGKFLRSGMAPGQIKVFRKALSGSNQVLLKVDQNNDGELNEEYLSIKPDSTKIVTVQKTYPNGSNVWLPFQITYNRNVDSAGTLKETFYWRPHYQVTGRFQFGACNQTIALRDYNGDGRFTSDDFKKGTSIVIDRNSDGEFRGKNEYLMGGQIIEYCGGRFTIAGLAKDGSSITFIPTQLPVPKVGKSIPDFTFQTTKNNILASSELKSKIYLLDFWASWCGPCIEKFDYLKKIEEGLENELEIIAINVDEPERLDLAKKIINQYSLEWPHVMNGLATNDPVWKMFGSMESNRLGIPLYVLIDQKGIIKYAGDGGLELKKLENEIYRLVSN